MNRASLISIAILLASCGGSDAPTPDGGGQGDAANDAPSGNPDGAGDQAGSDGASEGGSSLSFFVSSTGSKTGDLGGLGGADKKCQDLAAAVGAGGKTWHAYLSVEKGPAGTPINAKDRIGMGPWVNAKGVTVAKDLEDLHARDGDAEVFIDEKGEKVPGQWAGSPKPVIHDILTGSKRDGTLYAGETCKDWTSSAAADKAWVGHSDGLGPSMSMEMMYRGWNASHENGGCDDTAPRGGAGRIYCFAKD